MISATQTHQALLRKISAISKTSQIKAFKRKTLITERLLKMDGALGLIPAPLQAQRNTASVSFKKKKNKNYLLCYRLIKKLYVCDRYSKYP